MAAPLPRLTGITRRPRHGKSTPHERQSRPTGRDAANLRTRRARAAFPTGKTFHIWNEEASSIPAPTQSALRTLEWVGRRENLCVVGPSGTGKSHFCEALGQLAVDAACERRSLAVSGNLHPSGFDAGDSHRLAEATTGRGIVPLG